MTVKFSATTASSTAEATRAVVQEFLAARLVGDTGRLTELFADEVDWLLAENPAVPWIRPRST
ncbi:MAG TPA: ketosteroid isomerase, partial [Streptomyces sp.]